jgi:hypothetical protein
MFIEIFGPVCRENASKDAKSSKKPILKIVTPTFGSSQKNSD